VKDRFYEELEYVFDKAPKYHMKILLGDFSAKVGREEILNLQLGMEVYTKLIMIMELDFGLEIREYGRRDLSR
jgi:hypothetical protein